MSKINIAIFYSQQTLNVIVNPIRFKSISELNVNFEVLAWSFKLSVWREHVNSESFFVKNFLKKS